MAAVIYDLCGKYNVRIFYFVQEGVLEEGELLFYKKRKNNDKYSVEKRKYV